MEPPEQKPEPDDQPTLTLYRFCAWKRLLLDNDQRSRAGVELSRLARERQLPVVKVRERVGPGQWSKSRLYPLAFLNEWLGRFRDTQARDRAENASTEADESRQTQAATNG